MSSHPNRSAYMRSPWLFEVRDNPVGEPGEGQLLVEIGACGVCGTDMHVADRMAADWQPFGHEAAGIVRAVGASVTRFAPGDRVAMDSSAPCGRCEVCQPAPYGRGRPDLCPTPLSYYGTRTMGFGEMLLTPHQCAVPVPPSVPLDAACLVEPLGVSYDLVQTADVRPGDHVVIVGPGPLGLGAIVWARRAGAARVTVAGHSRSVARMAAAQALGADAVIEVDRTPLAAYDFGARKPDRVLVTAPPPALPEAVAVAAFGGVVVYIGIAWSPATTIQLDADAFHFRKLSLRASHASPGTHAQESIGLLAEMPDLADHMISDRFPLADIGRVMAHARDDRSTVKKLVMVGG